MTIEVEKRATLTPALYKQLSQKLLKMGAKDLGENNTENTFYLTDKYQLKITHNLSKKKAKLAWKSTEMGSASAVEEIEVDIQPEQTPDAIKLIEHLVPQAEKFPTFQERHDFQLGDTLVSLKYSDDWGHHIELDQNVTVSSEIEPVLEQFNQLAEKLGIHLLSEEEEKTLVETMIEKRQQKDK